MNSDPPKKKKTEASWIPGSLTGSLYTPQKMMRLEDDPFLLGKVAFQPLNWRCLMNCW